MKHVSLTFGILFSVCCLFCQAQLMPLNVESVTLNTEDGVIKGKLILPSTERNCPIVLLIAGSGPTDMDGNSPLLHGKNNSLKYLAEGLAENGIASLRFDKRGIATSAAAGKEESLLRFEDYVNDVKGWLNFLANDKRFTGITVIGHSEGALIGMLACRNQPKVKAFVSLAGAGRPAYEIIEEQVSAQPEMIRREVSAINESLKKGEQVEQVPMYLQSLYRSSVQPYLISWYKYDPQEVIATLKIPVLIVQGKRDIQISTQDAELLKKAKPAAGLLFINSMNHVLKDCDTMDPQKQSVAYSDSSLPVNTTLIFSLSTFINKHK